MEYVSRLEREFGTTTEPRALVAHELDQARSLGHDVTALRARLDALPTPAPTDPDDGDTGDAPDDTDAALRALYADIPREPVAGWPHFEASGLAEILAVLPANHTAGGPIPDLDDRIRGAWHGRVAGNMLGKPIEFPWPRAQVRRYLTSRGAYPLTDYVPIAEEDLGRLDEIGFLGAELVPYEAMSRGRIDGGVRDDDVDWTILDLRLLEAYGVDYTAYDVAHEWLSRLPVYQTGTAERVAMHNLVREVPLHRVADVDNPYREWIGALIRADVFGYVQPGNPRGAAVLAHRDAMLSHRGNGVYAAMWAAALIAAAFTADDPRAAVIESLRHVPPTSRLAVEVRRVLDDHGAGLGWEDAMDRLESRHPSMHFVHAVNNSGALTAAILWGGGDFTATVGYAAMAGLDADSIGATAGSWAGAFVGYHAIPEHWLRPLGGHTRSGVYGYANTRMDDLAARTVRLCLEFADRQGSST